MAKETGKYRECVKFGKNVKQAREELGLSQYQFSAKAKINRSYLAEIETGVRNPTLTSIKALAKGLGVSVGELVDGV